MTQSNHPPQIFRVFSWNIEGSFGRTTARRGTAYRVLDEVSQTAADVGFLFELHGNTAVEHKTAKRSIKDLARQFPLIQHFDYCHDSVRADDTFPYGLAFAKHKAKTDKILLENYRYALRLTLNQVVLYGIHFDHRSENRRMAMAQDLLKDIDKQRRKGHEVVVMGDFNATHRDHGLIGLLRNSRPIMRKIPSFVRQRLSPSMLMLPDMCEGRVMTFLEENGLRDADPKHRPTETIKRQHTSRLPALRLLQIDHILVSSGVTVDDFTIHRDAGSDHRAITATLRVG